MSELDKLRRSIAERDHVQLLQGVLADARILELAPLMMAVIDAAENVKDRYRQLPEDMEAIGIDSLEMALTALKQALGEK